jgi:hypothetical protein
MLLLTLFACRTTTYDTGEVSQDTAALAGCDELEWAFDADGDGWGAGEVILACEAPKERYVSQVGDCDDLDPETYPEAPERCDEVDNDCNGVVDDELVEVWFLDADADGYGAGDVVESCDPGPEFVANADDCDDLNPAIFPGAEEVCNELDDNCDAVIDEGVTLDFYADVDGDSYGDEGSITAACTVPSGHSDRAGDCDDTNEGVNPAATELCNGFDDNCDGVVDEDSAADAETFFRDADTDGYGDPSATYAACEQPSGYVDNDEDCDDTSSDVNPDTVWYLDYDGDSFGNSAWTDTDCLQPNGYVADATDCDDTNADIWPGADEYCNGDDDDCDGTTDEDDALDVLTWYEDADSDGYGNASVSDDECDQPSGYVADDTDCDDTDDSVHPGARERYNSVDDDCDGDVDDAWWTGSGADGDLTVTGTTNLTSTGDIVATNVSVISGSDVTVDSATGLAAGDEVLLINLHGSDSAYASVGNYEFGEISSISGSVLTLVDAVSETYGDTANSDLTDQTIVLQRVPQFADVTVSTGGELTVDDWDGDTGGVLAFRATGTVTVESGGVIHADATGYAGGATGSASNCDSYQGESYAGEGEGDGDGACTAYNETYGHWVNNYGGGGAHITGAGGSYGSVGEDGDSWTGGSATAPYGGDTYGSADLSTLFPGSGGGGVWRGSSNPGPGGSGAGIVYIAAFELEADDADAITAIGGSTSYWATGAYTYGAGGGSGGSVYLVADAMSLATGSVLAGGGDGEQTHIRLGGNGGDGRIRLDYNELNAVAQGSASTEEADACEPDAGYSATP